MATCFVIMPISTPPDLAGNYNGDHTHFVHVFKFLFEPAITAAGFQALPPMTEGSDVIHAEVVRKLETSDLVLCDMSTLNANVFFELGIRTALDLPACLVKDRHLVNVPFDTTLLNHHTYDPTLAPWTLQNEVDRLTEHIKKSHSVGADRNALWKYFGLTTRSRLGDATTVDGKIDLVIDLLRQASRIETATSENTEIESAPPKLRFGSDGDAMTAFLAAAEKLGVTHGNTDLSSESTGPRSARIDVHAGGTRPMFLAIYDAARQHGIDVQIRVAGSPAALRR